jgi:hypothetical protein
MSAMPLVSTVLVLLETFYAGVKFLFTCQLMADSIPIQSTTIVLAQADADLYELARVLELVLPESHYSRSKRKQFQQQIQYLEQWQNDNTRLFQEALWHEERQTYLSKYYDPVSGQMEWVDDAVSNNLLAFWNVAAIENDPMQYSKDNVDKDTDLSRERLKEMSLQLLRRGGNKDRPYSFDCGSFPLWSKGGCQEKYYAPTTSTRKPEKVPIIQPIMNYLVASGLWRNDDLETFGRYMSDESLDLLWFRSTGVYGEAYSVSAPYSNLATLDTCGNTSTLTAAIVYNIMVPDPAHAHRIPLPPIRRSWVITLITVELFVAFSIGVSCLVVSLNLVRTLRHSTRLGEPGEPSDGYDFNDDSGTNTYYDATSVTMPPDDRESESEEEPFLRGNDGRN